MLTNASSGCIARALNPKSKNGHLITGMLERQAEELNWDGITFLVTLNQIGKFEKQNPTISVNVFGYEKTVYPLRISEHE